MKKSFQILILVFFAISCSGEGLPNQYNLNGVGDLNVECSIGSDGEFSYQIKKGDKLISKPSILGIVVDGIVINKDLKLLDIKEQSYDSTWTAPWGPNKTVKDNHKNVIMEFVHTPSNKKINIEFRLFNDAVAFRYQFPEGGDMVINDELSEINIVGNPDSWYSIADFNTYESEYFFNSYDSLKWVATPLIMRRNDGIHIALNEAAILNYPDATFRQIDGTLKIELVPWQNGDKARIETPFSTPWRVVQIADDAKGILASQALINLSPENRLDNSSNFKPMTYVGIWWDFHLGRKTWAEGERQGALTYEALRVIDFAFRNNIKGVVIEGWNEGWDKWGQVGAFDYTTPAKGYDLKQIAEYAKRCDIRLIMHHETGGDTKGYEARLDSALMLCQQLGITDLKTGHAGKISTGEFHHGQEVVAHFEHIAKTAAKYNIAVDFHEPTKGSGLERTYPNIMTREGVRGLEWEAWSAGNSPSHTTLIPFTRGLSGATDYTPGIFDILYKKAYQRKAWNTDEETMKNSRVHSTLAHQLALMITIYSPWVMAADRIDNYENHPAFQFVRDLNPDYDETIILDAKIGEYIVVARRSGDVWYIGATTNEKGREILIPLNFIGQGNWNATIYKDGKKADWKTNPTDYEIEKLKVGASDMITGKLANGGGVAIVLKK